MIRIARLIVGAAVCLAFTSASSFAETPDYNANPILAEFARTGAKVFYLGSRAGLNGWFITKDSEIQIGYTPPDNQFIIVGALYDNVGNNITSEQIKILYETNREAKNFFDSNKQAIQSTSNQLGASMQGAGAGTTPAAVNAGMLPSAMSPGERLIQALQGAAGVDVGAAAAPKLYMVADPNCPHCQATWRALRDAVFGGKLQIHLVPVSAGGNPDSERAAAQFLHTANPLDAWDKYVAGDHTQLDGTPDATMIANIRNNHILTDSWHIQMTPYLTYRAKNGQVKIVQGEPEQATSIVDDIAP